MTEQVIEEDPEIAEIKRRAAEILSDEDIDDPKEALKKAQEEAAAEKETEQGDDTSSEAEKAADDPDAAWNQPAEEVAPEVVAQAKSRDEIILERLLDNIFDPEVATKYTKAVFYGDMGTSKTIASCDAGGMKVLLVAIENGAKSLRNHPEIMKHVKVMKVKSVNQIELLAEQLQKGSFPEYEVIVLDTFSELQKKDLDNMVDERAANTARITAKERYAPEGKEYQGNTEHMRRIAAAFRDVERNVIFVTHEREAQDDMSRVYVRPDLTDKVQKTLNSYVDVVARFTAEVDEDGNTKFFAQCRRTLGVTAKTRIGNLPVVLENPSFAAIHAADIAYEKEKENVTN